MFPVLAETVLSQVKPYIAPTKVMPAAKVNIARVMHPSAIAALIQTPANTHYLVKKMNGTQKVGHFLFLSLDSYSLPSLRGGIKGGEQ